MPDERLMGSRGMGMWVMSKLVLMIFLFSLMLVLALFMRVYSDKLISDTAASHVLLWSEIAGGSLLYKASSDTVSLPDRLEVRGSQREYTLMLSKVGDGRVVFLLSWYRHEDAESMRKEGFAAASALNMPAAIEEYEDEGFDYGGVVFFEGATGAESDVPAFKAAAEAGDDGSLVVKPSARVDRDTTLIFIRRESFFCVASAKEGIDLEASLGLLNDCCVEEDVRGELCDI